MLNVTLPLLRVQRLLPPEPLALRLTCQEEVTDLCIEPFRAPKNAKMTTGGRACAIRLATRSEADPISQSPYIAAAASDFTIRCPIRPNHRFCVTIVQG